MNVKELFDECLTEKIGGILRSIPRSHIMLISTMKSKYPSIETDEKWWENIDLTDAVIIAVVLGDDILATDIINNNADKIDFNKIHSSGTGRLPLGQFDLYKKLYSDGYINCDMYMKYQIMSGKMVDEDIFRRNLFSRMDWLDQLIKLYSIEETIIEQSDLFEEKSIELCTKKELGIILDAVVQNKFISISNKFAKLLVLDEYVKSDNKINIAAGLAPYIELNDLLEYVNNMNNQSIDYTVFQYNIDQFKLLVENDKLDKNTIIKHALYNNKVMMFAPLLLKDMDINDIENRIDRSNYEIVPIFDNAGRTLARFICANFISNNITVYDTVNNIVYYRRNVYNYDDWLKLDIIQDIIININYNELTSETFEKFAVLNFINKINDYIEHKKMQHTLDSLNEETNNNQ